MLSLDAMSPRLACMALTLLSWLWCGPPARAEEEVDSRLLPYKAVREAKGTITVVGSEDMVQVIEAWTKELQKHQPELKVVFEAVAPGEAAQRLQDGKCQVAILPRAMRAGELDTFKKKHGSRPAGINVGVGRVAVIVHPSNPLTSISLEQLDAIYSSTRRGGATSAATVWGDVGLKDDWEAKKVVPVLRDENSALHRVVQERILLSGKFAEHVQYFPHGQQVADFVAGERAGLGLVAVGFASAKVRMVPIKTDGKSSLPTAQAVLDGSYPLITPCICYVKFAKGDPRPPAELTEFVRFAQSRDGQLAVLGVGAVPLTPTMVDANLELFEELGLQRE